MGNSIAVEKEVYRIHDRKTNQVQGVYSRAYHDEYDFASPESARSSNCWDAYKDKRKYKINKYKVTYELIEDDCDCNGNFNDIEDNCEELPKTLTEIAEMFKIDIEKSAKEFEAKISMMRDEWNKEEGI